MPLLVCSAQHCVYNNGMYCGKGDIMVKGEHADKANETCCSSFKERGMDSAKSSVGTPSQIIQVDCTACNCQYNEEKVCTAEKIDITGASASRADQTACGTFEKDV